MLGIRQRDEYGGDLSFGFELWLSILSWRLVDGAISLLEYAKENGLIAGDVDIDEVAGDLGNRMEETPYVFWGNTWIHRMVGLGIPGPLAGQMLMALQTNEDPELDAGEGCSCEREAEEEEDTEDDEGRSEPRYEGDDCVEIVLDDFLRRAFNPQDLPHYFCVCGEEWEEMSEITVAGWRGTHGSSGEVCVYGTVVEMQYADGRTIECEKHNEVFVLGKEPSTGFGAVDMGIITNFAIMKELS